MWKYALIAFISLQHVSASRNCSEIVLKEARRGYFEVYIHPNSPKINLRVKSIQFVSDIDPEIEVFQDDDQIWKAMKFGGLLSFWVYFNEQSAIIDEITLNGQLICRTNSAIHKLANVLKSEYSTDISKYKRIAKKYTKKRPKRSRNKRVCGVSTVDYNDEGNLNTTSQWPWFVSFLDGDGNFLCSGSLITPSIILTAAHCMTDDLGETRSKNAFFVRFGRGQTKSIDIKVLKILTHPDYDAETSGSDVALIKIEKSEQRRVPVCLKRQIDKQTRGVALEWTDKQSDINIVDAKKCTVNDQFKKKIFCIERKSKDQCFNDWSTMLYVKSKNLWELRGITMNRLCEDFGPTPFTNVNSYYGWISKTVKQMNK